MIQIQQLKLHIGHDEDALRQKIVKTLRIKSERLLSYRIMRQSLDARKKPDLFYVYTIYAKIRDEETYLKQNKNSRISGIKEQSYVFPESGSESLSARPVVVGSGPAGLFCAYMLAKAGYAPLLIERGMRVENRMKDVENFWKTGVLNPHSNVQFGEGGAGTFSDGKLNTLVKDRSGRNREVLEIFVRHGAPEDILYASKPHIGTDVLSEVVKNMRNTILAMGGSVRFHTQMTGFSEADGHLASVTVTDTLTRRTEEIPATAAVLAIGHSARDTFAFLHEKKIPMEAKAFAVGVRMEHPQSMINASQYGEGRNAEKLPAAAYKLTAQTKSQRGVYTFCMCPGGYVVNASSEKGRLAVNGMSYRKRDGQNANSAVIVTVDSKDYGFDGPLAGIAFQRRLEEKAWELAEGKIPVQLFEDFCRNQPSKALGKITPQMKGAFALANVRSIFPEELAGALEEGIKTFGAKLPGYDRPDALVSGVESRTSSPVRILRDEGLESRVKGLYPCGEGAGYAGGITSAAMDGLKAAEAIARKYRPFDKIREES